MGDTSSSAIIEQSRNGKRFELRDQVLQMVVMFPSCTGKEVAVHVLRIRGVESRLHSMDLIGLVRASVVVASVQKRLNDLVKLNYVVMSSRRECEITQYASSEYVISSAGSDYLSGKGIKQGRVAKAITSPDVIDGEAIKLSEPPSKSAGRSALSGLRSSLGAG